MKSFVLQRGITLLLINLDGDKTVQVKIAHNGTVEHKHRHAHHHHRRYIQLPRYNKTVLTAREEYHLTAKDGDLHSQIMLLNGKELRVDESGNIPPLEPVTANLSEPVSVAPYSIVFVHIPHIILHACR